MRCLTILVFIAAGATPHPASAQASLLIKRAEVPRYPVIPPEAGIEGTARVDVTLRKGRIAKLAARPGTALSVFVSNTLANIRTWKFVDRADSTFMVTFAYQISGTLTDLLENSDVELRLPTFVRVIGRRVKPTVRNGGG